MGAECCSGSKGATDMTAVDTVESSDSDIDEATKMGGRGGCSLRKNVANENYELRRQWEVPRTVGVSSKEARSAWLRAGAAAKVTFSEHSTGDALLLFARKRGHKVCGLSFACGSDRHVGGGYKHGARAQEEDLCRRIPNLYPSLLAAKERGEYPLGPRTLRSLSEPGKYSHVLFTPGLALARLGEDKDYALFPPKDQVTVSVVSAVAPNVNKREVSDSRHMYDTVYNIFAAPKMKEPDITTLVLGAWGCGAFRGDTAQISELFARALKDRKLGRLYEQVHFAIPRFHDEDTVADAFRSTLRKQGVSFQEVRHRPETPPAA